jgi:hypothetical protein
MATRRLTKTSITAANRDGNQEANPSANPET